MAVAGGEERAVDGDRQIEPRAHDELLAVDVPARGPWGGGRVDPGLVRGHSHDAEERGEIDLAAALVAPDVAIDVQLPLEQDAVGHEPEALVQRRRPVTGTAPAPRSRHDALDRDLEHLPGLCAADLDRPHERMARIELLVTRLELAARREVPAGVECR